MEDSKVIFSHQAKTVRRLIHNVKRFRIEEQAAADHKEAWEKYGEKVSPVELSSSPSLPCIDDLSCFRLSISSGSSAIQRINLKNC